jgi:hypothetical protein
LVLNVWPVEGAVMMAGLVGRGPGTAADTEYSPPPSVAALVDRLKLPSNTPTAKVKKASMA